MKRHILIVFGALTLVFSSIAVSSQTHRDHAAPQRSTIYKMQETVWVGGLGYAVWKAWWSDKIDTRYGYTIEYPNASFLFVELTVGNEDNKPRTIPPLRLVDLYGAEYETSRHLLRSESSIGFFERMNPGVRKQGIIVFDAPQKSYRLKVFGSDMSRSSYALIDLAILTEKEKPKAEKGKDSDKALQEAIEEIHKQAALDEIQKRKARREKTEKKLTEAQPAALLEAKLSDYYSLIWAKIKNEWTLPENLPRGKADLEAVIIVVIEREGNIQKSWFEKRSGNALYDQMAMRAIKKAEPLPPIPKEFGDETFEIGIRFTPELKRRE